MRLVIFAIVTSERELIFKTAITADANLFLYQILKYEKYDLLSPEDYGAKYPTKDYEEYCIKKCCLYDLKLRIIDIEQNVKFVGS